MPTLWGCKCFINVPLDTFSSHASTGSQSKYNVLIKRTRFERVGENGQREKTSLFKAGEEKRAFLESEFREVIEQSPAR